jgi:DNA replication protein DnaC
VIHKLAEKNPEMIGSMITYSEAFASIRNEFLDGSYEEMGSVWDRLNNNSGTYDGVLLLDDVSAKKLTDFELDKFLMFLEKRFNYYLPFILTTNIKREDFKEVFGERIASRLIGYCNVVTFDGDKRIEKI